MKILVTGCSGFIGKNLINKLNKDEIYNYYCINSDIDITDKNEVKEIMQDVSPEVVVHLAAKSIPGLSSDNWEKIWKVNVDGTRNLLHNCKTGTRFIFASSITVHGSGNFDVNSPYSPTTIYAASKIAAETLVSTYSELNKLNGISLRLGAVVGPGLTHGVIKDFIGKVKKQENLEILGDWPGACKPYIHVDDVCDLIIKLFTTPTKQKKYIVSANDSCTIDEIADVLMEELGIKKDKVWLGEAKNFIGDNRVVIADNSITKKELLWKPSHNKSIDAIRKCIKENLV